MISAPYEIIDTEPVIEDCPGMWCEDGIVGDRYCSTCDGNGITVFDRSALFTLAHNLTIAALCEAAGLRGRA